MIVQRALVMFSPRRGAQIFQKDRVEIVADSIECGRYDANMGIDAADSHGVKTVRSQCLVEVRLEESAEPSLRQYNVPGLGPEVMQHLSTGGSPYGVRFQFALEEKVFPQETVIGEYHRNRNASASFQKAAAWAGRSSLPPVRGFLGSLKLSSSISTMITAGFTNDFSRI